MSMAEGIDDAVEGRKATEIDEIEIYEPRLGSQALFETPMCLVSSQSGLQLEENVLKLIEQIDQPLVVVAIAGLHRTGKSYLMNRLAGVTRGFAIGNSVQSVTTGIWAWCKKHPVKENTVMLLLDTEGLGDLEKDDGKHDVTILTLALLFSNIFVYNMMTVLNQDVLDKMAFVTELSTLIRFKDKSHSSSGDDNLEKILPTFVLCLRDFTLQLQNTEGNQITSDEYFEEKLKLKPDKENIKSEYNKQRECFMKYFPQRKCFTIDNPGGRDVIKCLEDLPPEKMSTSFMKDMDVFVQYIYNYEPRRVLLSKPMSGPMFGQLVRTYMNAVQSGCIPDVDSAFHAVERFENERLTTATLQAYKLKLKNISLPVYDTHDLEERVRDIQALILLQFRCKAEYDTAKYETQVMNEMNKDWDILKQHNYELIKTFCEQSLEEAYRDVKEKLSKNTYKKVGGYAAYRNDMNIVKLKYKQSVKGTDENVATHVYYAFLETQYENEMIILEKDKKISKKEKQAEIESLKKAHDEAIKSQEEMFERKLKEERRRLYEVNVQMSNKENTKTQNKQMMTDNWDIRSKTIDKTPKETADELKILEMDIEIKRLKEELRLKRARSHLEIHKIRKTKRCVVQ